MADRTEVAEVLRVLAKAYPRYSFDAETVRVYAAGLKDIDAVALQAGASKIITESKWFPAVSELREASLGFSNWRTLKEAADRRMAWKLLNSWGCCHKCWTRPCRCGDRIEAEASPASQLTQPA